MLAALLGVPKTTSHNWVYKMWNRQALELIEEAKTAGRLDSSGRTVEENLSPGKPKAGRVSTGTGLLQNKTSQRLIFTGTKRGIATKSTPKKGTKRKRDSQDGQLEAEFDNVDGED